MNVNFFNWLRDGVKQSVLLGVGDAIEQLGTPAETDQMHPGVAAFLHQESTGEGRRIGAAGTSRGRKRLGKSLKEIEPT